MERDFVGHSPTHPRCCVEYQKNGSVCGLHRDIGDPSSPCKRIMSGTETDGRVGRLVYGPREVSPS